MAKDKGDPRFNIPDGRDPGEFLTDGDLADYHRHLSDQDPTDPKQKRRAARAAIAAALTAASVVETEAAGAAELKEK